MSTDSNPGADRVARVAGIWRPIEMSDGDILKLFQSGKQSERNYRQFDGEWYVLDESPEAIAEASGQAEIDRLGRGVVELSGLCQNFQGTVDRLTAALAKVTAQRDRLLKWVKGMHGYERSEKNCDVCDFITAIEQGRE